MFDESKFCKMDAYVGVGVVDCVVSVVSIGVGMGVGDFVETVAFLHARGQTLFI